MNKKYLLLIAILINFGVIFAKNCGGEVDCECGDTVVESYFFKEDLVCSGDALNIKRALYIDCNGHKIQGNSSGNGIAILGGIRDLEIRNCNIQNFSNGVYFDQKIINGARYIPDRNKIYNNQFKNNNVGIYYHNAFSSNKIYSNHFKSNIFAGIEIAGSNNGFIWNNSFYQTGIYYKTQPAVKFCSNGVENKYFSGAIGPKCDCLIPYDGLKIIYDINLCPGSYYLPNGIGVYTKSNHYYKLIDIFCENTNLIGNGSNSGISFVGSPDGSINNCNIKNYENGVLLTWVDYWNRFGKSTKNSFRTDLRNNFISNVQKGIKVISSSSVGENVNNTIIEINDSIEILNSDKVFLEINLQPLVLNEKIVNLVTQKVGEDKITKNRNEANLVIEIGNFKNRLLTDENSPKLDKNPYSAQIISNKTNIKILSKSSSGYILAAKELVSNFENYKFVENYFEINNSNIQAIGVYDYLNFGENKDYYGKESMKFENLIDNVLNEEMFDFKEKFVSINLNNQSNKYRIWHFSSNKSSLLKSYIDKDNFPIVMAGGLWSDITTWEKLGKKLANQGFEVYLLEITGGNSSHCDSCYNYFYENLTNIVYPKYINHILDDSGSGKIKYVGHSNGARVALDSLSLGKVDSKVVDTLVLVGVPGAFEGISLTGSFLKSNGGKIISNALEKNISHLSQLDIGLSLLGLNFLENNLNKISTNLFKEYVHFINSSEDLQPGKDLSVKNLLVIKGDKFIVSDIIVPVKDLNEIYGNIESDNKYLFTFSLSHMGIVNSKISEKIIMKKLKNLDYGLKEKFFYMEEKNVKNK